MRLVLKSHDRNCGVSTKANCLVGLAESVDHESNLPFSCSAGDIFAKCFEFEICEVPCSFAKICAASCPPRLVASLSREVHPLVDIIVLKNCQCSFCFQSSGREGALFAYRAVGLHPLHLARKRKMCLAFLFLEIALPSRSRSFFEERVEQHHHK